jgi:hypothetical protein
VCAACASRLNVRKTERRTPGLIRTLQVCRAFLTRWRDRCQRSEQATAQIGDPKPVQRLASVTYQTLTTNGVKRRKPCYPWLEPRPSSPAVVKIVEADHARTQLPMREFWDVPRSDAAKIRLSRTPEWCGWRTDSRSDAQQHLGVVLVGRTNTWSRRRDGDESARRGSERSASCARCRVASRSLVLRCSSRRSQNAGGRHVGRRFSRGHWSAAPLRGTVRPSSHSARVAREPVGAARLKSVTGRRGWAGVWSAFASRAAVR